VGAGGGAPLRLAGLEPGRRRGEGGGRSVQPVPGVVVRAAEAAQAAGAILGAEYAVGAWRGDKGDRVSETDEG
jgi:hypothetical protein